MNTPASLAASGTSRPFQALLGAVAILGLFWLLLPALHVWLPPGPPPKKPAPVTIPWQAPALQPDSPPEPTRAEDPIDLPESAPSAEATAPAISPVPIAGPAIAITPGIGLPRFGVQPLEPFLPGQVDEMPRALSRTDPIHRGEYGSGIVRVRFTTTARGTVRDIVILESPNRELARLVRETLPRWVFEPGRKDGEKVPVRVEMPFAF